jgi:CheY-like chemotaxis protein
MYILTNSAQSEKNKYALKKLSRLHILVAEDNLLNAKLVAALLTQYGIKLQFAENGMQAIEKIKATHFDTVLMDMEMPVMNGYEATAIIRNELKNNIPIIALTASAQHGELEKCMLLGMNAYMPKPMNAGHLLNTIYKLTGKVVLTKTILINAQAVTVTADKVCNLDYLMGATHGNKKIMNNIVDVFFKETRKELVFLDNAIEQTNYPVISDISHKIRSAFSILGISVLEPDFKEMEQLSSSTSSISNIEQLNRRVNIVFNQAKAEMMPEN